MWHNINTHALGRVTFGDISYIPLWFPTAANTPIILFRKSKKFSRKICRFLCSIYLNFLSWNNFKFQVARALNLVSLFIYSSIIVCIYMYDMGAWVWRYTCHGIREEVRGQLLRFSPSTQGSQDQMQVIWETNAFTCWAILSTLHNFFLNCLRVNCRHFDPSPLYRLSMYFLRCQCSLVELRCIIKYGVHYQYSTGAY